MPPFLLFLIKPVCPRAVNPKKRIRTRRRKFSVGEYFFRPNGNIFRTRKKYLLSKNRLFFHHYFYRSKKKLTLLALLVIITNKKKPPRAPAGCQNNLLFPTKNKKSGRFKIHPLRRDLHFRLDFAKILEAVYFFRG